MAAPFTHVAGNPPYVRWAKVPEPLRLAYSAQFPSSVAGGDLLLPFLHRAFSLLAPRGRCGLVGSDRWRYAAYGQAFRAQWLPLMDVQTEATAKPSEAFTRDVYVYPDVLIALRHPSPRRTPTPRRQSGDTLEDLGCTVRVGPALGLTSAFVVPAGEMPIEPELLHRWVDTGEVGEGSVNWRGRRVIATWGGQGDLVGLESHPRLAAHLSAFRERLARRYIVRHGAAWYRTIDRFAPADWAAPKLLVPELAKVPRLALGRAGAIPSHGIYCIFSPVREIEEIYDRLRDGKLAKALAPIAPKVKGSYTRCYGRFLSRCGFRPFLALPAKYPVDPAHAVADQPGLPCRNLPDDAFDLLWKAVHGQHHGQEPISHVLAANRKRRIAVWKPGRRFGESGRSVT